MELLLFLGELIGKHKVCMQQDEEEGTESWLGGNLQNRRYYNHTILHIYIACCVTVLGSKLLYMLADRCTAV